MIIQSGSYYMDGAGCLIGPMVKKKGNLTSGDTKYPYFMSGYEIYYSTSGAALSPNRKNDLVREVKDDERERLPVSTAEAVTHVGAEVMPAAGPQTFEGPEIVKTKIKSTDPVAHPSHYGGKDNPYETIKVMRNRLSREEYIGALKFNVYKYNDRAGKKGATLEDHRKALFYQTELVAFLNEEAEADARAGRI